MIYSIDDLWKPSEKWDVKFENGVIYIDDFYENADDILLHLDARPKPLWKYSEERVSPNGVSYNDCRIVDKVGHPTRLYLENLERIKGICRQYFWKGNYALNDYLIEVNCFKSNEIFDPIMQHFPHIDGQFDDPDESAVLNFLVFLDKQDNGGTALYHGDWLQNREHESLLQPTTEMMDLNYIIPAQFNRCVIFPGNQLHGAWINDYDKYLEHWRYTQVMFLNPC